MACAQSRYRSQSCTSCALLTHTNHATTFRTCAGAQTKAQAAHRVIWSHHAAAGSFRLVPSITMSSATQIFDRSGVPASKGSSEKVTSTICGLSCDASCSSTHLRSPVPCSREAMASRKPMPMGITMALLSVWMQNKRLQLAQHGAGVAARHGHQRGHAFPRDAFPFFLVFSYWAQATQLQSGGGGRGHVAPRRLAPAPARRSVQALPPPNKVYFCLFLCYHRGKCTVPHSQQVCRQRADSSADSVQTACRQV